MAREWQRVVAPDNVVEIEAVEADAGTYLGYGRLVGRRRAGVSLDEPIVTMRSDYTRAALLRVDERAE